MAAAACFVHVKDDDDPVVLVPAGEYSSPYYQHTGDEIEGHPHTQPQFSPTHTPYIFKGGEDHQETAQAAGTWTWELQLAEFIVVITILGTLWWLFWDTSLAFYYWRRFTRWLFGSTMNGQFTQPQSVTTGSGQVLSVGDKALLHYKNGLKELVTIESFENGGLAFVRSYTGKSQCVFSSQLDGRRSPQWSTWKSLKKSIVESCEKKLQHSTAKHPREEDIHCNTEHSSSINPPEEPPKEELTLKAEESLQANGNTRKRATSMASTASSEERSKNQNKNIKKKKKKQKEKQAVNGEGPMMNDMGRAPVVPEKDEEDIPEMTHEAETGVQANGNACGIASAPGKSSSILKTDESLSKQREQDLKVKWDSVSIREYARFIGGSGGVPGSGGWPLGLSNQVVVRDGKNEEMKELSDVFDSERKSSRAEQTVKIEDYEEEKRKRLDERKKLLDPKYLVHCTDETRQFSHRKHSNPLFDRIIEPIRADTIQDGIYSIKFDEMDGNLEDNSTIVTFMDNHNAKERGELDDLRYSRSQSGCSCRHIALQAKTFNKQRLEDELESRNLPAHGSQKELLHRLTDNTEDEPICTKDCPCVQDGVQCHYQACSCCSHLREEDASGGTFQAPCRNPYGFDTYSAERVNRHRTRFILADARRRRTDSNLSDAEQLLNEVEQVPAEEIERALQTKKKEPKSNSDKKEKKKEKKRRQKEKKEEHKKLEEQKRQQENELLIAKARDKEMLCESSRGDSKTSSLSNIQISSTGVVQTGGQGKLPEEDKLLLCRLGPTSTNQGQNSSVEDKSGPKGGSHAEDKKTVYRSNRQPSRQKEANDRGNRRNTGAQANSIRTEKRGENKKNSRNREESKRKVQVL